MAKNRKTLRREMGQANKDATAAARSGDEDALRRARQKQAEVSAQIARYAPDGGHPDSMLNWR